MAFLFVNRYLYTNAYGGVDNVYVWSRRFGGIARDVGIMAWSSPGNIAQYIRRPDLYELGSTAMTNANYYLKYGLDGLNAVQKGRALLLAHKGSYLQVLRLTRMGKAVRLLPTGPTPGGGAALIGIIRAIDD